VSTETTPSVEMTVAPAKSEEDIEKEKFDALPAKQKVEFMKLKMNNQLADGAKTEDYLAYKLAEKKAEEAFVAAEAVLLVDNGGQLMLHIPYEPLRKMLGHSIVGYSQMGGYHSLGMYDSEDSPGRRKDKDSRALFSLPMFMSEDMAEKFENYSSSRIDDVRTRKSYEHFLTLIQEGKTRLEEEAEQAIKKGNVSFDQLSIVLRQGMLLGTHQWDKTFICVKLKEVRVYRGFGTQISCEATVYGFNGTDVVAGELELKFRGYKGLKTFAQLGIEIMDDEKIAKLAARGQKHLDLTKQPYYGVCTGNVTRRSWYGTATFRSQGRCMIDMVAMKRTDTNYSKWFGEIEPSGASGSGEDDVIGAEEITQEVLACMSPYVYGFSFASKIWGEMLVDEIETINFRDEAWDQLVLESSSKKIVKALVQAESLAAGDFIDGKGGGCIFLLHGPPGTGKTLTAEAVAEKLHRPLYMVGIGELGTDVAELEDNLKRILDTAHAWRAVLLIDEADIFLEERSDYDVKRNAMVGVFLRLLEYYPGILFLTSNRAQHIDGAIQSRLSLMMHYPALGADDRTQIWKNILGRNADGWELTEDQFHVLGTYDINGRQVKNVVRVALTLASQDGRKAGLTDFVDVIERLKAFETDRKK
jgi:hypothetical protein